MTDAAQLLLPYAAEDEDSTPATPANHVIRPRKRRSNGEITATKNVEFQELDAGRRRQGRKKPPAKATVPPHAKLLVGREEAAERLSLGIRSVDYLLANRQLKSRRIGGRVLVPVSELERFVRLDHPERIAG